MLLGQNNLGVWLKSFHHRALPSRLRLPAQTQLPPSRPFTTRCLSTEHTRHCSATRLHPTYAYPLTRPYSTLTMFKQAVQSHNAAIPTPLPISKQQSLGNSFNRTATSQSSALRPTPNATKQYAAAKLGSVSVNAQGIKRTSSGLAKSLSFHEDPFAYPTLNIVGMEKENDVSLAPARTNSAGLATALFDEDDFDSDVDLDVEDPATKGTVSYPKLPQYDSTGSVGSKDSGYQSRQQTVPAFSTLQSSQEIPWSSSPVEHFKTPQKPVQPKPKTKRAFLPWSQNQQQFSQTEMIEEVEDDTGPPKKRQSVEAKQTIMATPKPKAEYAWNTTASAVKEQQKRLREQNKKQMEKDVSVDDLKEATKKRKKNTVHRIFLSDEQQNVLNLVTEYKKSVFFTGSAGVYHESCPSQWC